MYSATTETAPFSYQSIEHCVVELLRRRAMTASICPSDVARTLFCNEDKWRGLMPSVRQVAAQMAREGKILITQGSATLDPVLPTHGPIHLRRGPRFGATGD